MKQDADVPGVIRMSLVDWAMLSELARLRALRLGGQRSLPATLRDLIRDAADDLPDLPASRLQPAEGKARS
jgi:hypothetical protein